MSGESHCTEDFAEAMRAVSRMSADEVEITIWGIAERQQPLLMGRGVIAERRTGEPLDDTEIDAEYAFTFTVADFELYFWPDSFQQALISDRTVYVTTREGGIEIAYPSRPWID